MRPTFNIRKKLHKTVNTLKNRKSQFLEDFGWFLMVLDTESGESWNPYPNLLKILDDLPTLNNCNFFVFKYFLDRKKGLKSRDANSFISGENIGPTAHYEPKIEYHVGRITSSENSGTINISRVTDEVIRPTWYSIFGS